MRVTSDSASASSLTASAASRALNDPVRIEPAKTRIFGVAISAPDAAAAIMTQALERFPVALSRNFASSSPGLSPQVGFTRLAVLISAELGQARVQVPSTSSLTDSQRRKKTWMPGTRQHKAGHDEPIDSRPGESRRQPLR